MPENVSGTTKNKAGAEAPDAAAPEAPPVETKAGAEAPDAKTPTAAKDAGKGKQINVPVHGPGSKVNWDNEALAPTKRKSIADDPTGKENLKLIGGDEKP